MATLNGNRNPNLLTGTDNADLIRGRGGDDTLIGAGGNDTLNGGNGDDRIEVGLGDDQVNGGKGTDTVVFSGNRDDYTIVDLGNGRVRVIGADGDNEVSNTELFEFADMTQTLAELLVPREPNLTAASLAVDDISLAPGEDSTVTFDLISNGTGNAGESSYELVVATAPDETAILSVLDSQIAAALATGSSATLTATIPADTLAPGTYWVAVRVDAGDALGETDETDNLTDWVQITVEEPVTDLAMTAAVAADSDLDLGLGGGMIAVDYTIDNVGNTGPTGYRLVAVLSRDGTISADDIQIGEVTGQIGLDELQAGRLQTSLAEDFEDGDWQVLTELELTGGATDADPANNSTAETVSLAPAYGDLQLNATTLGSLTDLDLNGGGRIQMTYDWANTGTTTPSYFVLRTYLSTDTEISADDMRILGISGGTYTGQQASSTTIHYFQADFTPGDYYLISEIVWGDGSSDPTADNQIVQQITFTAPDVDLAIDTVTLDPASDLLLDENGIRILADVDVSNLGGIAATATVTAWLSTDDNITGDDIQIYPGSITVGFGGTETLSIDATITDQLAAGDYTLIVALTTPDDNASNSIFYTDLTLEGVVTPPGITGTEGDDLLVGTADGEEINALGGNDTVVASEGFDVVDGGDGFDVIDFSGETEAVRIAQDFSDPSVLNRENVQTFGLEQTYTNFEKVIGSDFDDLAGIFSSTDDFHFDMGAGNDVAVGSDGNDTFEMGTGNDSVSGGQGDDLFTLGDGADMLGVTRHSAGPFPFGDGNDRVTDFDVAEDIIVFQIVNGTTYDPLADTTQTAEGALISYVSGSSLLLEGVDMADLSAANFLFDDTIYVAT